MPNPRGLQLISAEYGFYILFDKFVIISFLIFQYTIDNE